MYLPLPSTMSLGAIRRMAKSYIKRKYGFTATASEVSPDHIGWLEPVWHRGTSGVVAMQYQGKAFYVEADRKAGVLQCTDTYQAQEFIHCITNPLNQQLATADSLITARYGSPGYPGCSVGMGIRTFEDLVAQGGIEVCISACGVDAPTVYGLDLTHLGSDARMGVFVWRNRRAIEAAYVPNNPLSISDADTIYLADYYRYQDGTWTHQAYEHAEGAGVSFAYPANLDIRVTPTAAPVKDDASTNAASPWYELSTTSDQETRVMVFPHQREANHHMRMQLFYPATGRASESATNIPSYIKSQSHSPAIADYPYHTFVWLNLTSRKGWVQRGPILIRICSQAG